jgi:hypothetical protein
MSSAASAGASTGASAGASTGTTDTTKLHEAVLAALEVYGVDSDEYADAYYAYQDAVNAKELEEHPHFNDQYSVPQTQTQFESAYDTGHQMFDVYKQFNNQQAAELQQQAKGKSIDQAHEYLAQMAALRGDRYPTTFAAFNDGGGFGGLGGFGGGGSSLDEVYNPNQPSIYDMAKGLETEAILNKVTFRKE